jgi:hypothetical protein
MNYLDPGPLPVESTPNPTITTLVLMLLRYILTALSVLGVVHGTYSDSVLTIVASSLVGVGTVVVALVERVRVARHTHATAVVNAARPAGSFPVQPG